MDRPWYPSGGSLREFRLVDKLVRVRCIDQDHAGHALGIEAGIDPDLETAGGLPDENIWRRDPRRLKQRVQILCNRGACPWGQRGRVAPAITRAIVPTHSGELRDPWLHPHPTIACRVRAHFENDDRTPSPVQ
jgi:hypothetical protein